jgi:hypothetical protein
MAAQLEEHRRLKELLLGPGEADLVRNGERLEEVVTTLSASKNG